MAIDSTLKGSSSNSYVSVADADSYFEDRLGSSSWNSISDDIIDISSASISGTFRLLDNETTIVVSGIGVLSPTLSVGDRVQMSTNLPAVDGTHFVKKVNSSTGFTFAVSGDQSSISTITYLDRSDNTDKAKSLIMATRFLDQLKYKGERTTTTQKLSFPRMFLPDPDASGLYWGQTLRLRSDYLDKEKIPDRIIFSTYELALRFLSDPELTADPSVRQFKKVSIEGVLSVDFNEHALPRVMDRNILNYLGPLLESGSTVAVSLKR